MIELDAYGTLVAATLVLLLGRELVRRIRVLDTYSIPQPVAGGLLVAAVLVLLRQTTGTEVRFDTGMSQPLMLTFFASIGLNASIASLKQGGRRLVVLIAACVGMLVLQNLMGTAAARLLGEPARIGLLAGSISLAGGHGTGAAWGQVFMEQYGMPSAAAMALASATFGLVLGGVIGGPVARHLITRHRLTPSGQAAQAAPERADDAFESPGRQRLITAEAMIETIALMSVCLLGGRWLASLLQDTALSLPTFVCVLFVGVVLRNTLSWLGLYDVFERAVSVLGNVGLSLFLAISLMSLRVDELTGLALPLLVLLGLQTLLMVVFTTQVIFRLMGRNYEAAVISAGVAGIGLGATPTAIANMQAVTDRFGPAHAAFLIVPMVGAFFIDIANALVIKVFLSVSWLAG